MSVVAHNAHRDGDSGMSTPMTVAVCIASVVAALTLGVLTWRFIIWRRNKGAPLTPTSTKPSLSSTTVVHLPRKPELVYLADAEKGQEYADQIPSPKPSPPPAYSLRLMKNSPASKKSTSALNLDVGCDVEVAQQSPLRYASSNPSINSHSLSPCISSRVSMDTKKLPRLMTVTMLYVPSLSDELSIRLGETLRMIEEYEDEWCLVQRVGRTDERGVIPRFCLVERQEIIPSAGKRTTSGLLQTPTFRK